VLSHCKFVDVEVSEMDDTLSSLYAKADVLRRQLNDGSIDDSKVRAHRLVRLTTGEVAGVCDVVSAVQGFRQPSCALQSQ